MVFGLRLLPIFGVLALSVLTLGPEAAAESLHACDAPLPSGARGLAAFGDRIAVGFPDEGLIRLYRLTPENRLEEIGEVRPPEGAPQIEPESPRDLGFGGKLALGAQTLAAFGSFGLHAWALDAEGRPGEGRLLAAPGDELLSGKEAELTSVAVDGGHVAAIRRARSAADSVVVFDLLDGTQARRLGLRAPEAGPDVGPGWRVVRTGYGYDALAFRDGLLIAAGVEISMLDEKWSIFADFPFTRGSPAVSARRVVLQSLDLSGDQRAFRPAVLPETAWMSKIRWAAVNGDSLVIAGDELGPRTRLVVVPLKLLAKGEAALAQEDALRVLQGGRGRTSPQNEELAAAPVMEPQADRGWRMEFSANFDLALTEDGRIGLLTQDTIRLSDAPPRQGRIAVQMRRVFDSALDLHASTRSEELEGARTPSPSFPPFPRDAVAAGADFLVFGDFTPSDRPCLTIMR